MEFDTYAGLLRMHDTFTRCTLANAIFTHDSAHPAWVRLRERWPLEAIAGEGDGFSRAVRLLQWLSLHTFHDGSYDNRITETATDLLAYAFGQTKERGVNCRALSIILTECLLAIGIPARTVSLIPASPYDGDNHVVVMAHVMSALPETTLHSAGTHGSPQMTAPGKWVMLDPTWNAVCLDETGHVLDLWELRALLANRGTIRLNPEARYNRRKAASTDMAREYRTYMAKNLYYLHCPLDSGWDPERRSPPVFLAPDGFDAVRHRRLNLEYRLSQWGPHPLLEKWLADALADHTVTLYATPDVFFSNPYAAFR